MKDSTNITEVKRIPQRIEGQQGNTPRKVLVKFSDSKMQKSVLEKAKDMKKIGNGWEKSFISPDLTKKQREKAYLLRVERRRRTEAGETNLVIRNGEVVVRNQASTTPFPQRAGTPAT